VTDDTHPPSPDPAAAGPEILIDDRQELPVDLADLRALALACLRGEGIADGELSISLVSDEEIADLHVRFLGEEGPTDVLSFGVEADDAAPGPRLLGDVVIAPATAARNARSHDGESADEIRLLLAHGILHLLGYDHGSDAQRATMWAKQEDYSGVRTP
jgi:probable rRNA maturation factor